jgi:hypothetical protein
MFTGLIRSRAAGYLAVAAGGVMFGAGGLAFAASGSGNVIHACANKKTGALRLAATCKRNERRVLWQVHGPQGLQGATGARGPQGIQGSPGQTGFANIVVRTDTLTGLLAGSDTVKCNPGERAIGGGVAHNDFSNNASIYASAPVAANGSIATAGSTPTAWATGINNTAAVDTTFYAVCASP